MTSSRIEKDSIGELKFTLTQWKIALHLATYHCHFQDCFLQIPSLSENLR